MTPASLPRAPRPSPLAGEGHHAALLATTVFLAYLGCAAGGPLPQELLELGVGPVELGLACQHFVLELREAAM